MFEVDIPGKRKIIVEVPEFSVQPLGRILDALDGQKPPKKYPSCLVVLDDVVHDLTATGGKELKRMLYTGRHYGCIVFISSQHWSSVPLGVRINSRIVVLMSSSPSRQVKLVEDDLNVPGLRKAVRQAFEANRYSFILLNSLMPPEKQIWLNYDRTLTLEDEEEKV